MMVRRSVLGVIAGLAMVVLSGCNPFGPSSYRYKITIEVKSPQGVKAFSSVRAMSYSRRLEGGYNAHVEGEAVIMDLPGGPVFALMTGANGSGEYAEEIAEAALESELRPGGANRDYRAGQFAEVYPTKPNIRHYMPKDPLPLLVRFGDINDPKSIERVDPASIRVTRVTVEKTSERVTTGIEKRLGWLKNQRGSLTPRLSAPDPTNPPLSATITEMDFSSETKRGQ